jgi:UDP-glucuronate 4-epimerase
MAMIEALEQALGVSARLVFSSKQPGDVDDTHADVRQLHNDFGYRPSTSLNQGLRNFVAWYRDYFKV